MSRPMGGALHAQDAAAAREDGARGRVLLPTLYATRGGSTRVLLATAEASREAHEVIVRAPIPEADERPPAAMPNRPLVGPWRKLAALPRLARLLVSEAAALRRLRPDLIHVHDEPALYVYGLAARVLRPRPRVVWHLHARTGRGLAARARVRLADEAVVISTHADAPRGLPHRLIRNALGPHGPKLISERGPAARLAALGVIGAIYPLKGQELAVRALAALRRLPRGEGARLILVGPEYDAGYAAALRRLIAELDLDGRVVLAGSRPPEAAFDGVGLALFPSRAENQPLALAEALAGGLPVVASDIPAHRVMLEEVGADPASLSAREPHAFAEAILAAAARAPDLEVGPRAAALYAPERFAREIRALHRDGLASRRR